VNARSNLDVTIIVPVFNEKNTILMTIENLKSFQELTHRSLEVIIVDNNSNDGSTEILEKCRTGEENWKILHEIVPGKGAACRKGITQSKGRFIAIFDADLEYDISDLEMLLNEIEKSGDKVILGSRHSGNPIRVFNGHKKLALYYNIGHEFFTHLFNLLFSTRLKDPATMWKVFDGDLGRSLQFTSNRFDFDWEILAFFIRQGHVPKEFPIKYHSRTPEEGKKIRPIADPAQWIFRLVFLRLKRVRFN
jgi:glycosyltransferase involved in cell wall biosynthesis